MRHGKVTAERPQIVTPFYLSSLFRGFEHGEEFARYLSESYGSGSPGLMYSYRNDLKDTSVVSDSLPAVAGRLAEELERDGRTLAAVIKGVDLMWDISWPSSSSRSPRHLWAATSRSWPERPAGDGLGPAQGCSCPDRRDVPGCGQGRAAPQLLKAELDRWGVFKEYEDRFLDMFRRR